MPQTFTPRQIGHGQALQYQARGGQIKADVAKGATGTNMTASFQPRPPMRPPGLKGVGDSGSFVDAHA